MSVPQSSQQSITRQALTYSASMEWSQPSKTLGHSGVSVVTLTAQREGQQRHYRVVWLSSGLYRACQRPC